MCYVLLLSTTSDEDLARLNTELVRFERELPAIADVAKLRHPHRWYVGSKSGCSCTFRHALDANIGFGEPEDWCPEEPDNLAATLFLMAVIRRLVESGESLDCVNAWHHQAPAPAAETSLDVDLSKITDREFRFFENHCFSFTTTA
jgi:hypothetical protein